MNLIAYFTEDGIPKTGLTPTIDAWEMDGTHAVNAQNMTEIAGGGYYYDFAAYDTTKDYFIRADGGAGLSVFERYVEASNEVPINVDNTTKVDELHKSQGLDVSNPMTVTPTSRVAGTINQVISGDGETTSTVTRT